MRKLASIAIVFAGLSAITYAAVVLSAVSVITPFETGPEGLAVAVLSMMPSALSALFGVYLIYNRHNLAEKWFEDEPLDMTIDALPVLRVGLILIGVSVLVQAVATVMMSVAFVVLPRQPGGFFSWSSLANPVTSIVLGAILVWRSEALSAFLWRTGDRERSRA